MKKIMVSILIIILSVSSLTFAGENKIKEEKIVHWIANEEELAQITTLDQAGYNFDEIIQIVNPNLYKKLQKSNNSYLKTLKFNDFKRSKELLENDTVNISLMTGVTRYTTYRIQYPSLSHNEIVGTGWFYGVGTYPSLINRVKVVDTSYTWVALTLEEVINGTNNITTLIAAPSDGRYYVHTDHNIGYIDQHGTLQYNNWPSNSDWFDFSLW